MLFENYFETLDVLHLNTEPNRAYYIPASEGSEPFCCREKSDRFQLLNGEWDGQSCTGPNLTEARITI